MDILEKMIEMNADEWNLMMAGDLGIPVESLKNSFALRRSLSLTESRNKMDIDKSRLRALRDNGEMEYAAGLKWFSSADHGKYLHPRDRYVNNANDSVMRVENSCTCTGKVIVGLDFSHSDMQKSVFNGCTFFNCVFNSVLFDSSVFLNCIFNLCDLSDANIVHAQFSRCRFLDCSFDRAAMDYTLISDCMLISCQFVSASLMYTNISYSGLNECNISQSSLRLAKIIVCSVISSHLGDSDFRNASLFDVAFVRCNCIGSDFLGVDYIAISAQDVHYEGPYGEIFQISREEFSPATREWDIPGDMEDPDDLFDDDSGEADEYS